MSRQKFILLAVLAGVTLSCATREIAPPDPDRLAAQAVIRRDTFGIPHIIADSEEAAAFAFGYAQAEDHAAEIGRRHRAPVHIDARLVGGVRCRLVPHQPFAIAAGYRDLGADRRGPGRGRQQQGDGQHRASFNGVCRRQQQPPGRHQADEQPHVQHIHARRLLPAAQFQVRRHRAGRQQHDDTPAGLAAQRREQQRLGRERRDPRRRPSGSGPF